MNTGASILTESGDETLRGQLPVERTGSRAVFGSRDERTLNSRPLIRERLQVVRTWRKGQRPDCTCRTQRAGLAGSKMIPLATNRMVFG